jgi:soluble lytic murein transglycosylase-like protein
VRVLLSLGLVAAGWAQPAQKSRQQAESYLLACARHYGVPADFARAVVEQESGWHTCAISSKGAVGLMQLMPETAQRLGVTNRCDPMQNISGGIRYLAWLSRKFHGDLRLVAAAYYVGERKIERHGLEYSNPDVVAYVSSIRQGVERQRLRQSPQVSRRTR